MMTRVAGALLLSAVVAGAQPRALIGSGKAHATATITPVSASARRVQLLVTLEVEPGWHVSWRNPGETGLPTRLSWNLPAGVRVTGETWPVPLLTHTDVGDTHTLEGSVPWLVDLQVDSVASVDRLISLTMRYGICREVCIPEQITVQGALPSPASLRRAVPISAAVRARLATRSGAIAARRVSPTLLCLAGAPSVHGAAAETIVADSGLGMDATLHADRRGGRHGIFMKIPPGAMLRDGADFLFVRGAAAVAARLDLRRPAPECRGR